MRDLFNLADADGSGTMDIRELEDFVKARTVRIRLQMMGLDVQSDLARRLFKVLDQDNDGLLDIQEFANGCLTLRGPARCIDTATILREVGVLSRQVQEL